MSIFLDVTATKTESLRLKVHTARRNMCRTSEQNLKLRTRDESFCHSRTDERNDDQRFCYLSGAQTCNSPAKSKSILSVQLQVRVQVQ